MTEELVDSWLRGKGSEPGWIKTYDATRTSADADVRKDWAKLVEKVTSALWATFIEPVDSQLRRLGLDEGAPVLLAAPGQLSVLPLHAAWRVVDGEHRPFGADWTVSYFPGGVALAALRDRRAMREPAESKLLAVADPAHNLTFSSLEVEALERHFSPVCRRVLSDSQATKQAVLAAAPSCTHVHFACHGRFHWKDPMSSALQLADGQLTLTEIFTQVDLPGTDLAVLSACETALIDLETAPDEHVGLPAAFLDAGATSVVSTLWAVDDASTALVIARFYELLMQRAMPASAALRQATEWVRTSTAAELNLAEWWEAAYHRSGKLRAWERAREYRAQPHVKPYGAAHHWAAFVLTGAAWPQDELRSGTRCSGRAL